MRIMVTGVTGQLGHDVADELASRGFSVLAPRRDELDLTDSEAVIEYVNFHKPDCVMHCAAYTAVDKAEEERALCRAVNSIATEVLAKVCGKSEIPLLYVSTDYVFGGDGEEAYEVDSEKNPMNEYGISKSEGEEAVRKFCPKSYVVRTSWVFGANGANFVKTVLKLADLKDEIHVVDDQIGSPTYTKDLAPLLCDILLSGKYGVYHATNEGFCSFYEFACEIVKISGKKLKVHPTTTEKYNSAAKTIVAKRPHNSRLSKSSLTSAGFPLLPSWQNALSRYLCEIDALVK